MAHPYHELIIDNFAGGGGASTGIRLATGRDVDLAINHDDEAVQMHLANHPHTQHFCEDVWRVDPVEACCGIPVALAWFSPDCKHFSKAKGTKPVSKKIRGLAWLAVKWAKAVRPRILLLENVEEFITWGPLGADSRPCPKRKGQTFARWVSSLKQLGYVVEWRELKACDYGAPTTRKRLFVVARCDGEPIVWPKPTHGPNLTPYRTAAECIDWSLPCPSIFERDRPLADNTMRRIARGILKYVVNNPRPFIVPVSHSGDARVHSIDDPLRTVTGSSRSTHALVAPTITRIGQTGGNGSYTNNAAAPLTTVTSKAEHLLIEPKLAPFIAGAGGPEYGAKPVPVDQPMGTLTAENHRVLVVPTLIETANGERTGQAPRAMDIQQPMRTARASGSQGALVSAFLAKHNGIGDKQVVGQAATVPLHTITSVDQKAVVTAQLAQAGDSHAAEVRAFLIKYYGTDQNPELREPLHTLTTKERFALVTVEGVEYEIVDIGMRMLTPRELFRAQGFPDNYIIGDDPEQGLILTKSAQVRMCGNSVCPPVARALVAANFNEALTQEQAA